MAILPLRSAEMFGAAGRLEAKTVGGGPGLGGVPAEV